MGEKPSFPKVNLKYASLEVFAKAVRKSFGQGRLLVRLKKQFEPGQRLLLIFQIGDRAEPVEIIGQVIDRVEDKQKGGFAYGIRFLNFTENKLNRLLAEQESKPAEKKTEAKIEPEKPAPSLEKAPALKKEPEKPAPAKETSSPESGPPPVISKPSEKAQEAPSAEEEIEIEVTIQTGGVQTFDGRPLGQKEELVKTPKSVESGLLAEKEISASEEPLVMPWEKTEELPAEPIKVEVKKAPVVPELARPTSVTAEPAPVPPELTPSSTEPSTPEVQEVKPFQLTPPEPLAEELEAEPVIDESAPSPQNHPLLEYLSTFAPQAPDVFIQESPPSVSEKTSAPLLEPDLSAEPKITPEPAGLESELEDFSPTPELLKEAKPLPKLESVPVTPKERSIEIPLAPEEEITELTNEVLSEKPITPVTPEPKMAPLESAPEFKPMAPEKLSDFLFRFCRMVLNPPHPEQPDFQKQFQSLYEDFQKLMESRNRVGIYLVLTPSGKDFIIEGAQPSPKSIRILLPQDQLGTLLFRLFELFDQKELLGIIFRKYLNLQHFQNFILTLGQFNPAKESPDELALKLIRAGIYHFNLILETDLIAVPEKIKEDTKIILARVSGELKRLKTLAEQIGEDPLALLTLRLEDIIRPIKDPEVIAQTLEHLPLTWTGQIQEFEFQDLEDQILFSIPVPLLTSASEILLKRLIQLRPPKTALPPEAEKTKANLERLLRRVMARIAYEAPELALQTLSQLFDQKLIKYEELPEEIRDQVAASKLAEDFLKNPDQKISELEKASDPSAYSKLASQLLWSSIALLEKKEFKWAQKIFQTLVAHYQDKSPPFPDRPKKARESLKRLADPFAIEILSKMLATGKKEERELSAAMLYATGEACVKKILLLLEQSPDRNVRRLACEILARIGHRAVPDLLEKLNQPDLPWYLIRNIIMILAEIKSPAIKDKLASYLKHPHPRVREEAINYLLTTDEQQTEAILTGLLKDPEPSVRRRALSALGKLEKLSPETSLAIKNFILDLTTLPPEASVDLIFQQGVELLLKAGAEKFSDGTELGRFFFELLDQAEARGIFSRPKLILSPKMKIVLIEALGKKKFTEAKKLLSKLLKDKDEAIKKSAEKALELIERK